MQAEASGRQRLSNKMTAINDCPLWSVRVSTKCLWFCLPVCPVQKQPQYVDGSVDVPVPQYANTFCVLTQSHTVAVGVVFGPLSAGSATNKSEQAGVTLPASCFEAGKVQRLDSHRSAGEYRAVAR